MTTILPVKGGLQEALVVIGNTVHVFNQRRHLLIQVQGFDERHGQPELRPFQIEAVGLEWGQAKGLDPGTRFGRSTTFRGKGCQ